MLTTDTIFQRGIDLYENGEVKKTRVKGIFTVHGYVADLNQESCTCKSHEYNPHMECKHKVAAMRKMLDDLRYRA